jgi:hypothetical protein
VDYLLLTLTMKLAPNAADDWDSESTGTNQL